MKTNKIFKTIRNFTRRTFSVMFCLVLVFESFALVDAADDAPSLATSGYKWTRIRTQEEMRSYKRQIGDGDWTKLYDTNFGTSITDNNEDHWTRALMIYSNDNYIFGDWNTCQDGESYAGKRISVTYDIDVSKDSFVTRTGLGTPYLHYAGYDGDNSCDKYYVRFANSDDSLSDYVFALNQSWYGVAYHAAGYGQYIRTKYNDLNSNRKERSCSCSTSVIPEVSFHWLPDMDPEYEEMLKQSPMNYNQMSEYERTHYATYHFGKYYGPGYVEMFYNLKGVADRHWCHEDQDYEIEACKYPDREDAAFMLFLGSPTKITVISDSINIQEGYTEVYNGRTIPAGIVITVPAGATLIIDGITYNNGGIVVDGGTLIVNGILDSDINVSAKNGINPGEILIQNGGVMIIEASGTYIARGGNGGIIAENSNIVIDGSMVASKLFMSNSALRARSGSAIFLGCTASSTVQRSCYGRSYIKEATGVYADYLVSGVSGSNAECLKLTNSSLYADGILFRESGRVMTLDGYSRIDAKISTNIHSSLHSMVRYW